LTPSHARKSGRRYRYYISHGLNLGPASRGGKAWRLPARELERTVAGAVRQLLGDEPAIASAIDEAGVAADRIASILEEVRVWRNKLDSDAEAGAALSNLVHRVELRRDGLRLALVVPTPALPITDPPPHPAL